MSENILRRVCTIVAREIDVDTVTPRTKLNLGDRGIGGYKGLHRMAAAIEAEFHIQFGRDEPELWTDVNDMIEATEILVEGPARAAA